MAGIAPELLDFLWMPNEEIRQWIEDNPELVNNLDDDGRSAIYTIALKGDL